MTTQEKLIAILSRNCEIKIYPRGYPPDAGIQGSLADQTPFCIGYWAEWEDKRFVGHCYEFSIFIDSLYEKLFKKEKEEVPV